MADRVCIFLHCILTSDAHKFTQLIQGRGGGRGRGAGGPSRGRPQGGAPSGDKPKREAILDLSKYVNERIRVKFTGGREGASLSLASRTGLSFVILTARYHQSRES